MDSDRNISKETSIEWRCRYTFLNLNCLKKLFNDKLSECVIFTPDIIKIDTDSLFDFSKPIWIYFFQENNKDNNDIIFIAKRDDSIYVHFKVSFNSEVKNGSNLYCTFEDFWHKYILVNKRVSYSSSWDSFYTLCLDTNSRTLLKVK